MKFKDIPQRIPDGHYQIDMPFKYIEHWLEQNDGDIGVELNPDFQRGHVWTPNQQRAFLEFLLEGGKSSRIIYFNCPGWLHDFRGPIQCIDGLQRLTAVRKFMNNEISVFDGYRFQDFEDRLPTDLALKFNINNLPTRKLVLEWYLQLNSGGTPHTAKELERVRKLYEAEG